MGFDGWSVMEKLHNIGRPEKADKKVLVGVYVSPVDIRRLGGRVVIRAMFDKLLSDSLK